jgi:cytosine permease
LALAFGWGFLITGLLAGGALGSGVTLWGDLIWYSLLGSAINFVIGALVGYMAWRTGCNSTLIFRAVYGEFGAYVPVIFIALLTIGWQGIVVGAFAQIWTQAPGTALYYGAAIFAGILFTGTTLFGVKGLERVGIPAMIGLVLVGLYAAWVNIDRFARTFWIAMGIPFVVLVVDQLFLHLVGALGAVGSGTPDFTAYLGTLSGFAAIFGLVGMTLALWTTGDTNLYLPSVQTASLFRKPKRVTIVICGLLGTILGLGIYQMFLGWIALLATIVPPIVGPVIAEYYIVRRRPQTFTSDETLNWPAIMAFGGGALLAGGNGKAWFPVSIDLAPSLLGLLASLVIYLLLRALQRRMQPDH